MKAAELIDSRTPMWRKLEMMCAQLESSGQRKKLHIKSRSEFASLYRSACADLALADSHQLPAETVRFLHQLVGRAHNQLYRTKGAQYHEWYREMFQRVPRRLFHDPYLRVSALLFWGLFLIAAFLSSSVSPLPGFAESVLGKDQLIVMEQMYTDAPSTGRTGGMNAGMAGFYISHNTSIGLRCFVWGIAFGVGGMFVIVFNALQIGAVFGHMSTTDQSDNFFHFVTAHGPFELTAVVLSGAAGMRIGFALIRTNGLSRIDSLTVAARQALPIMMAAVFLFVGAAFIEGFISPSKLPYELKAMVAMVTSLLILGYMIGLGWSDEPDDDQDELLTAL